MYWHWWEEHHVRICRGTNPRRGGKHAWYRVLSMHSREPVVVIYGLPLWKSQGRWTGVSCTWQPVSFCPRAQRCSLQGVLRQIEDIQPAALLWIKDQADLHLNSLLCQDSCDMTMRTCSVVSTFYPHWLSASMLHLATIWLLQSIHRISLVCCKVVAMKRMLYANEPEVRNIPMPLHLTYWGNSKLNWIPELREFFSRVPEGGLQACAWCPSEVPQKSDYLWENCYLVGTFLMQNLQSYL